MSNVRSRRFGALAECKNCGYKWDTIAKKPQCPKCQSWHINVDKNFESIIPYLLGRFFWEFDRLSAKLSSIEKLVKKQIKEEEGE